MSWNREKVEAAIKDILIENLCVKAEEITPASLIEEDLGADSLKVVEISMAMQHEFKIEIPDKQAARIKTFQQAVDTVCGVLKITE